MQPRDPPQLWIGDIDPDLVVRRGVRAVFVLRHNTSIARIDPGGFQLLPGGQQLRLDVTNVADRQRMRELIAGRLGRPAPEALTPSETFRPPPKPGFRAERDDEVGWHFAPPEPELRRDPTAAEVAEAITLLAEHGVKAWRPADELAVQTDLGDLLFTTWMKSASAAVRSWLNALAEPSQEQVRELVRERLAAYDDLRLRSKAGGGVQIRHAGVAIAKVNRFFLLGSEFGIRRVDLLNDATALDDVAALLDRRVQEQKAPPLPPPRPVDRLKARLPPHRPPTPVVRANRGVPARAPATGTGLQAGHDVWVRMPSETPPAAVAAGLAASERLRRERRLELAVPVEVETRTGLLVFSPLRAGRRELVVEFSFRAPGALSLDGALLLDRPRDPIPLRAPIGTARSLVGTAWAAALIVYADLTCTAIAPAISQPSKRVQRTAAGVSRPSSRGSRPGSVGGRDRESATVRSIAEAIERLQSVCGFVRRLPTGQSASTEQLAAAAAVGIRVPTGCTWVRPHVRSSERLRVSLGSRALW